MKKTLFTFSVCVTAFAAVAQAEEPVEKTYTANVVIPTSSVGENALLASITPNDVQITEFLAKTSVSTTTSGWYGGTTGANGGSPEQVMQGFDFHPETGLTSFNINSRNNVFGDTYGVLVLSMSDICASTSAYGEGAKVGAVDVSLTLDSIENTANITSVKYSLWKYQGGTVTQVGDSASWTSAGHTVNATGVDVSGFNSGDALVLVLGEKTATRYWKNAGFTLGVVANGTYPVVPEPATATLSLLVLAGLAARRRRK